MSSASKRKRSLLGYSLTRGGSSVATLRLSSGCIAHELVEVRAGVVRRDGEVVVVDECVERGR